MNNAMNNGFKSWALGSIASLVVAAMLLVTLLLATMPQASGYGAPRRGWSQAAKGDPVYLTYSYNNLLDGGLRGPDDVPLPVDLIRDSIENALAVWTEVAPIHFTEVADQGGLVSSSNYPDGQFGQIRLSHRYINGPDRPGRPPTTKALAWFPTASSNIAADIHFDDSDPWQRIGTTSTPDVLGAAIHEIGHTLGLTHSSLNDANMYWIFERHTGPGSGHLFADDIAAIQSVYGAGTGSVTPLSVVPEPTTLGLLLLGALARAIAPKLALTITASIAFVNASGNYFP